MFNDLLFAVLKTAFAYMAIPIVLLLIRQKRFDESVGGLIALCNSIVLGLIFCILSAKNNASWNAFPAFLYYYINKRILTKKSK